MLIKDSNCIPSFPLVYFSRLRLTGTSKGAATANGNADIDLSPESVHTKMTVSKDGRVEVDFTVTVCHLVDPLSFAPVH